MTIKKEWSFPSEEAPKVKLHMSLDVAQSVTKAEACAILSQIAEQSHAFYMDTARQMNSFSKDGAPL